MAFERRAALPVGLLRRSRLGGNRVCRKPASPGRQTAGPRQTTAFSLIETALAVLILGGSLATILSLISTSVNQVGQQKAQSSAVGFAAGQMNKFLFETPFTVLATTVPEEVVVDGVWFQYQLEVQEVPNADIKFRFKHFTYHDPRHGSGTATGAEPIVPAMTDQNEPVTSLDSKFTGEGPILKDLLLTVKWHGPGEKYTDDFSLKLISRKARL